MRLITTLFLMFLAFVTPAIAKPVGVDMTASWFSESSAAQHAELVHLHKMGGTVTRVEDPGLPYNTPGQLSALLQMAYNLHIKVFLGGMGPGTSGVVKRFPHEILGIEVGNEPNNPAFYQGTACQYVGVLRTAYQKIKGVDPRMPVIGGSVALTDTNYVRQLIQCGIRRWADALSVHPYSVSFGPTQWNPPATAGLSEVEAIWKGPVWVTEFGYPSTVPDAGTWDKLAVHEFSALPFVSLVSLYCMTGPFAANTI